MGQRLQIRRRSGSPGILVAALATAKDIAGQVRKQRDIAASLTCPDAVELEEGGTFTCTARARGEKPVEVRVTQTDDRGTVSWET